MDSKLKDIAFTLIGLAIAMAMIAAFLYGVFHGAVDTDIKTAMIAAFATVAGYFMTKEQVNK